MADTRTAMEKFCDAQMVLWQRVWYPQVMHQNGGFYIYAWEIFE